MERLNIPTCLDVLRRANAHLANFFARFSGAPVVGTREEVEGLLQVERTLRSVATLLEQGVHRGSDQLIQDELATYGTHLARLRRELAIMQSSAAECQARLFARQKHLHVAQAWCAAVSRSAH